MRYISLAVALLLALSSCRSTVRSVLYDLRRDHDLPALAALVFKDGQIVANEAVGTTRIRGLIRVSHDSKWHLGACTKPITVTLLALLVEEGKLSWESKVADVLPEVRATMHSGYADLTLRMLVANRSGLPVDELKNISWQQLYDLREPLDEQRKNIAYEALQHEPIFYPGQKYRSSRIDYVVAAAMAERATGTPFEKLVADRILVPLGMTFANFGSQNYKGGEGQPLPHVLSTNGYLYSLDSGRPSEIPKVFNSTGNLHMSLADWAKFIAFQLGLPGTPNLLSEERLGEIHNPSWDFDWGGHFVKREWADGYVILVQGSNGRNQAQGWAAPNADFAVLIASNAENATPAINEAYKQIMAIYMPHARVRQGP